MTTIQVAIPDTTYVSSGQPNTNFSFYPLIYTGTSDGQTYTGYLKLTLPSLPVSFVSSAKLKLAVIVKSGTEPSPVVINKVTEPFDISTVTYNAQPAYEATASGADIAASDLYQTVDIDITSIVNQWLNGAADNNGLALTNSDGTTIVQFATNNIAYPPYYPILELSYQTPVVESSAICFAYQQLAHVINQIMAYYPTTTITVYTTGFNAAGLVGVPYQFYTAPDATYGGFLILDNGDERGGVPLNVIAAIDLGEETVFNPAIDFLTPPDLPNGCDKNIISAIYGYMSEQTDVQMYLGILIEASGAIYRNEYAMTVLAGEDGTNPVFVPPTNITAIIPTAAAGEQEKSALPRILVKKDAPSEINKE